jgi:hypothetical protein
VDNFESYAAGAVAVFQKPTYSGNTTGVNAGDTAAVSTEAANDALDPNVGSPGTKSDKIAWQWTTAGTGFIRLTTYNTANKPNPFLNLSKGLSIYLKLPSGQIDLQLIVRETGGSGPIGANGGASGTLERTANPIRIEASSQWQYVYFDIPNETWSGYSTGNGVLTGSWGTLEALSITAVSGDPATNFTLFVDDIYQGPAQHPSMTKIVDNDQGSPVYTETGTWATSGSTGYNGLTYRYATAGGAHTATWDLSLPASGSWKISVIHRAGTNRCTSTKFVAQTASGAQTVYINQQTNDLTWVTLGTWNFNISNGSVQLDAAGSTGGTVVIADAVKAEKQ